MHFNRYYWYVFDSVKCTLMQDKKSYKSVICVICVKCIVHRSNRRYSMVLCLRQYFSRVMYYTYSCNKVYRNTCLGILVMQQSVNVASRLKTV